MRILHIFSNYERLHAFVRENIDSCLDFNKNTFAFDSPTGKLMFKVIVTHEDFMQIAGHELSCVIWHYTPSLEVKQYVQSRIRYLK